MPEDEDNRLQQAIAARLRLRRESLGLSMNAVAKAAGMDQRFISRVEKAEQMPSLASLLRICAVLKMKLAVLFREF